jgi:hypothetical protein
MMIIQIIISIIYLDDCPIKPFIPIYNLIADSAGISFIFLFVLLLLLYFVLFNAKSLLNLQSLLNPQSLLNTKTLL